MTKIQIKNNTDLLFYANKYIEKKQYKKTINLINNYKTSITTNMQFLINETAYKAAQKGLFYEIKKTHYSDALWFLKQARFYLKKNQLCSNFKGNLNSYNSSNDYFFSESLNLFNYELQIYSYLNNFQQIINREDYIQRLYTKYKHTHPQIIGKILITCIIVHNKIITDLKENSNQYIKLLEYLYKTHKDSFKNPEAIDLLISRSKGFFYFKIKNYTKALKNFKIANSLSNDKKDLIFYYFAEIYLLKNKNSKDKIKKYLIKTEELLQKFQSAKYYYLFYYTAMFYEQIDYLKQLAFLKKAIQLTENMRLMQSNSSDKISYFSNKIKIYEAIINLYIKQKEIDKAYYFAYKSKSKTFNETIGEKYLNQSTFLEILKKHSLEKEIFDFFFIKSKLIIFHTHKNNIKIIKTNINYKDLNHRLSNLFNLINRTQHSIEPFKPVLREQIKRSLIELLSIILPEKCINTNNITIIPHLLLHNFPFYSLKLFKSINIDIYSSIIALYKSIKDKFSFNDCHIDIYNNPLNDLNYADKETLQIKKNYKNIKEYKSKKCSINTFLKSMSDDGFLHFIGHSYFNQENPENSWIALSDKKFYLELCRTQKYKKKLIFLSSCLSGKAKEQPGDELISFPRHLLISGIKIIIYTLWILDDKMASDITGYFYSHLRKEKTINRRKICKAFNNSLDLAIKSGSAIENIISYLMVQ